MSSIGAVVARLHTVLETSIAIGKHVQTAADHVDDAVLILRHALSGTSDAEADQLIALFADLQDQLAHQAGIVGVTSATVAAMIDRLAGGTTPEPSEDSTSIPHPSTTDQDKHRWIARDAEWAARRVAELPAFTRRTHAVVYDGDGTEHRLVSGRDEYSARAQLALRNSTHFPPPHPEGWYDVVDHVETKLAMLMREQGITTTTVVINHPKGVCRRIMGCVAAVRALLPQGYVMMVWKPGDTHPLTLKGNARP